MMSIKVAKCLKRNISHRLVKSHDKIKSKRLNRHTDFLVKIVVTLSKLHVTVTKTIILSLKLIEQFGHV